MTPEREEALNLHHKPSREPALKRARAILASCANSANDEPMEALVAHAFIAAEAQLQERGKAVKVTRNSEALASFTKYCEQHPHERFWQALRNWSRWAFILGAQTRDGGTIDTFNLDGLDGTRTGNEHA